MKNETVNIGEFDSERALADLRAELDAIDDQLLETIRLRLDCCSRIGHLKKTVGIPMMQPQRENKVLQRAEAFAVAHGLSEVFLRKIYATITEEACRLEDLIIGGVGDDAVQQLLTAVHRTTTAIATKCRRRTLFRGCR